MKMIFNLIKLESICIKFDKKNGFSIDASDSSNQITICNIGFNRILIGISLKINNEWSDGYIIEYIYNDYKYTLGYTHRHDVDVELPENIKSITDDIIRKYDYEIWLCQQTFQQVNADDD